MVIYNLSTNLLILVSRSGASFLPHECEVDSVILSWSVEEGGSEPKSYMALHLSLISLSACPPWKEPPCCEAVQETLCVGLCSEERSSPDSPAPVKPSDAFTPSDFLTAMSQGTVSQEYPAKLLPDSDTQKWCEMMLIVVNCYVLESFVMQRCKTKTTKGLDCMDKRDRRQGLEAMCWYLEPNCLIKNSAFSERITVNTPDRQHVFPLSFESRRKCHPCKAIVSVLLSCQFWVQVYTPVFFQETIDLSSKNIVQCEWSSSPSWDPSMIPFHFIWNKTKPWSCWRTRAGLCLPSHLFLWSSSRTGGYAHHRPPASSHRADSVHDPSSLRKPLSPTLPCLIFSCQLEGHHKVSFTPGSPVLRMCLSYIRYTNTQNFVKRIDVPSDTWVA